MSGAIARRPLAASAAMACRHMYEVSGHPWTSRTGGPEPSSRWASTELVVQRKLVDVAARVAHPADDDCDREGPAEDREDPRRRHTDERDHDRPGEHERLHGRAGKVDLLAGGRYLGVERAHDETYSAAATKVIPNMNAQSAARIRPVRTF